MKTLSSYAPSARRFSGLVGLTLAALAGPALGVNLLTDPGFESNPLTTAANSLNNFPGFQGVWGQENSTIVGVANGVTPFQGVKQLQMDATGGVTTQTFQAVDV